PRDRGGSPGGRGGRVAFCEDLSGYDLRQPGDGDGHACNARAARHEEAPAPRAGPYRGGKLLVENRGQTTIFTHMMARRHAFEKMWSVPGFSCLQSARWCSPPAARPGLPTTTPTP